MATAKLLGLTDGLIHSYVHFFILFIMVMLSGYVNTYI